MYKLIIVDDEAAIREGIASSIPWAEWGFEVVGLYANGQQALDNIEKDMPHVVLSDICMPKLDGVELMQILNKRYPQIKIIILSGYSDFEYLNMSIKNNVSEYLLKPTDIDEFAQLFKKVRGQLDTENEQRAELEKGKELQHVETLNLLLKGYLGQDDLNGTWTALREECGLHLENCVVLLLTPDGRLGDEERELYLLKARIAELCNRCLAGLGGQFFLNYDEIITGVLGLPPEENLEPEQLKLLVRDLQAAVVKELHATVSAGVSLLCTEPDMLPGCYQQAKCCVRQNIFLGQESIFFYYQFEKENRPSDVHFDVDILRQALVENNFARMQAEIQRVFEAFENQALKDYEYVDRLCLEALFGISRWALQYNVRFEQVIDSLGTTYADIYRCDSLSKKQGFVVAILFGLQQRLREVKGAGHKRGSLAYMVKNCVDEQFSHNALSLEYVAERMNKTPAHISKVFKNELGYNFSEYLTKKRLERSIELLGDPQLKVYEIAGMVGYADTSNFIKVFKKNYGISPNEYRTAMASRNAG